MISRLRLDGDTRLFEIFVELAQPTGTNELPYILQQFPDGYNDEEVKKNLPNFAFPYANYRFSGASEHFTFALTDLESKFRFGFCRLSAETHTCLCIVSCLPWYEVFYSLLDTLYETLNGSQEKSVVPLLTALHSVNTFNPGQLVSVTAFSTKEKYSFICPVQNQLPSLPDNKNLSQLFHLVDVNNLMALFASMIQERRILIISDKLSRLTACVHAAARLLYPMCWQHLYIPVLPLSLLDYCSAPMPYLIGLHSSVIKKKMRTRDELGDVVILDVDANTLTSEYDDLAALPSDVTSGLKRHLKAQHGERGISHVFSGEGVSRAFLKALVALIGGYRDALKFRPGQRITFDPDAFILSRSSNMRPFLKMFLQMQIFQQFINERLDMLNAGEGFNDPFETEVNECNDKWGTQSRYKDWLGHMKVQGKKLKREGKDKWSEFASKVKDKSKKTIKDLKSKMDENKRENNGPHYLVDHVDLERRRPPRPPPPNLMLAAHGLPSSDPTHQNALTDSAFQRTVRYRLMSPEDDTVTSEFAGQGKDRVSIDDSNLVESSSFHAMRRVSTDLMNDVDILNAFKKSYSLEDLSTAVSTSRVTYEMEEDEDDSGHAAWVPFSIGGTEYNLPAGGSLTDISSTASIGSLSSHVSQESTSVRLRESIAIKRPVPIPRRSLHNQLADSSEQQQPRQSSNPIPSQRPSNVNISEQPLILLDTAECLDVMDLDPLKTTHNSSTESRQNQPAIPCNDILMPIAKPRKSKLAKRQDLASGIGHQLINLSPAGSRDSSPGPALHQQGAIEGARSQFTDVVSKSTELCEVRKNSLDQFDPLASGQLAIDRSSASATSEEKDLLQDWNLDFAYKLQGRPASPGGPQLASMLSHPRQIVPYGSMPGVNPRAFPPPSCYTNAPYMGNNFNTRPSYQFPGMPGIGNAINSGKNTTLPPNLQPTMIFESQASASLSSRTLPRESDLMSATFPVTGVNATERSASPRNDDKLQCLDLNKSQQSNWEQFS